MKTNRPLPLGKLKTNDLNALLSRYARMRDKRVLVGPKVGEDAAVIEYADRYLIVKTDPITFTTDQIGWYAVHINANDVACMGATPKWFLPVILLPHGKTKKNLVDAIFKQIYAAAKELNVSVIGGHTEVTHDIPRPIIVGTMLGEVKKNKLVLSSGARPGDELLLTKGIAIEGTAIIAHEKEKILKQKDYPKAFIERSKKYLTSPGISVVKEALLANQLNVHAMHDPTEGGLLQATHELALASNTGMQIDKEAIFIHPESKKLCQEFGLDPYRTLSSGSLLIAAPKNKIKSIMNLLERNGIASYIIGKVTEKKLGIRFTDGARILASEKDEITKLFE